MRRKIAVLQREIESSRAQKNSEQKDPMDDEAVSAKYALPVSTRSQPQHSQTPRQSILIHQPQQPQAADEQIHNNDPVNSADIQYTVCHDVPSRYIIFFILF